MSPSRRRPSSRPCLLASRRPAGSCSRIRRCARCASPARCGLQSSLPRGDVHHLRTTAVCSKPPHGCSPLFNTSAVPHYVFRPLGAHPPGRRRARPRPRRGGPRQDATQPARRRRDGPPEPARAAGEARPAARRRVRAGGELRSRRVGAAVARQRRLLRHRGRRAVLRAAAVCEGAALLAVLPFFGRRGGALHLPLHLPEAVRADARRAG